MSLNSPANGAMSLGRKNGGIAKSFSLENYRQNMIPLRKNESNLFGDGDDENDLRHLYVLPVLLFEFLALAVTRAVLPAKLLAAFGSQVYVVMGICEFVRGLFAFVACPLFGRISDSVGRRPCLFVTVLGTCAPVCSLALFGDFSGEGDNKTTMWVFVILLALSGCFSATFTLTFAYVSDTVPKGDKRVAAYGLALATFGLSFTIGPMAGGYLARNVETPDDDAAGVAMAEEIHLNEESTGERSGGGFHGKHSPLNDDDNFGAVNPLGEQRVFLFSFILVMITLLYIAFILPETVDGKKKDLNVDYRSFSASRRIRKSLDTIRNEIAPDAWKPFDFLRLFSGDPLLAKIGQIVLLYYTGVYAVVSTMILYAVKRFHFGPERLGELMSAFGFCTMVAEIILVRFVIPTIGEKLSLKVGLMAFTLQCIVLGFAYEGWHLFICVALSMVSNLSYPSVTSLVSNAVSPDGVGEALGAINGIKALTEGIGPLVFGALMTMSEKSSIPGWPYLLAALFSIVAYQVSNDLPDEDESYINEKFSGAASLSRREGRMHNFMGRLGSLAGTRRKEVTLYENNEADDEVAGLLSDIDEGSDWTRDEEIQRTRKNSLNGSVSER